MTSAELPSAELPALVLQQGTLSPPGLLAEWANREGIELEVHHTYLNETVPEVRGRPFVCCLGSAHNPNQREVPAVARTLEVVGAAVDANVPVLGLCYGGQALSVVLGGTVERSPEPQHGWYHVETDDPEVVPAGPWLEWHWDRFSLPPGATELAHTETTVQAFSHGPHLGVQFHPESTIEVVEQWARKDQPRMTELGVDDGVAMLEAGRGNVDAARQAAFSLFGAFWSRVQFSARAQFSESAKSNHRRVP